MRIASNTLYNLTTSRLNRIKGEMLEANTKVTTGKKINTLSDDPVKIAPILNLKSSIAGIDQYGANIATGRQWLEGGETALGSIKDQIIEAKTTSISMNSGIITSSDFVSGAEVIAGIRDHILTLANTQVNGQFIYSGTKTNIRPFIPDDVDNPTRIGYEGGENVFKIKMAEGSDIEVGYSGKDVFQNPYIVIDETNNKIDFREDPAASAAVEYGAELTATIPFGKYTHQELAVTMEAAMTTRSAAVGQPEVVGITDNNATVVVNNYSALNIPGNVSLTYTAATNAWAIAGPPGYVPPISYNTLTSDDSRVELDFTGNGETDVSVNFDNPVPGGYNVSFDITAAAAGGNDVDYSVNYNEGTKRYTIMQEGGPPLDNLEMMWATGSNAAVSLAPDIGFDTAANDIGLPDGNNHSSDEEVEWGIFRTLIELEEYLINEDSDGINRSIARLSADFDHIGSVLSEIGIKGNRLDVRDNIITDLNISYETTKMRLEDADMIAEITKLNQKEFAYEAAMSSTAKVLNMSLLDFL